MFSAQWIKKMEWVANASIIAVTVVILCGAFYLQLAFEELPCPLCILQRLGLIFILYGGFLNLRYGFKPSHYGLILLSGLFTSFVALRQIVLHIIPGTGSYGSAIMGYHLYTWSFMISMGIIILTTILLSIDRQYVGHKIDMSSTLWRRSLKILFFLIILVILGNIISTLFECGLSACPDNPTTYRYL